MKSFLLAVAVLHFVLSSCHGFTTVQHLRVTETRLCSSQEEEQNDDDSEWYPTELVQDDDYDSFDDEEWLPDREKARRKKELARRYFEHIKNPPSKEEETEKKEEATTTTKTEQKKANDNDDDQKKKADDNDDDDDKKKVYNEEEEELINAMGGKPGAITKREPGYLGDSTLIEIATDYSVPVCYIADVLCTWGVPVPIQTRDRLGDLVTGEQAFAILEAIHSLDISVLQDRYSNQNLVIVCDDRDIDLRDAFQMAVKEGWSLPFGVQTCLRVEQEEELIRVLGAEQYE